MRLQPYLALIRFNRPIGWLLLLWPTLMALWMAAGETPSLKWVLIFVAGVFLTRSAGCAINDYADRKWDGAIERTRNRPLVTGALQPREALFCFALLMLLAFGLVLLLPPQAMIVAVIALGLAALYPFTKRFSGYPQLFLGLAFSCGIPMAYVAAEAPLGWEVALLFAANVLWTFAYDTWYGLTDKPDDLNVGIKSSAISLGPHVQKAIGVAQGSALVLWGLAGWVAGMGFPYFLGLGAVANLFVNQHKRASSGQREDYFHAFLANNRAGAVLFGAVWLDLFVV